LLFRSKHTVAVATHAHVLQKFYTTWVRGVACQKQRLGPKLEGAGLGEYSKIWNPLHISATVEASNFKFGTQIGFGTSLPKRRLTPKLAGVLASSAHTKLGPLRVSATVKASNFKFGTQIWFGTSLPKNDG